MLYWEAETDIGKERVPMKYLIYGAGGIGGCLAAFLAQGGKDVSLIARGAQIGRAHV